AFCLLRPDGIMGMVATNTIGQGDTRESGLAKIIRNGGEIIFAHRFIKWPGAANVEVNLVTISKGKWKRGYILDGKEVWYISSRLDDNPEATPKALEQNENRAFEGDVIRGTGFLLEPAEARLLIEKNAKNTDCIFPYLNGQDLNNHPEQKPSRYIICFHDWSLEIASKYPDLIRIVEERVKPEREQLKGPGDKKNQEYWWQFGAYRAGLRAAIASLQRVLIRSRVSELHSLVFVPKGYVYGDATVVFAFDDYYHFALLQSNVHEVWVWYNASSLESRNRYTPTDCFDTFPFPHNPPDERQKAAELKGVQYHEYRRQIMLTRQIGLTKTYNLFHNPDCLDKDIVELRKLHIEMDKSVMACYGWEDLIVDHDFYKNERGQIRFTVSSQLKKELIRRLIELNIKLSEK
ncbi:MAG: restriction endonuclease, partial [Candidatus Aminicenantes bacterium]|nr:restriction endonuclease [Candidatus Aminicenantes bacterium]